jgi:hypothetical protein
MTAQLSAYANLLARSIECKQKSEFVVIGWFPGASHRDKRYKRKCVTQLWDERTVVANSQIGEHGVKVELLARTRPVLLQLVRIVIFCSIFGFQFLISAATMVGIDN